jgi:hypothetical protein
MKRFLATLALTCALSGLTLGADMPTCGVPAPSSTESSSVTTSVILTIISLVVG